MDDSQNDKSREHLNSNGITSFSLSMEDSEVPTGPNQFSVTTVLTYCKNKILKPYLRFLCFMGLRPMATDQSEACSCLELFSYLYTLMIIGLLVLGYVLQYMACFRRDRGFGCKAKEPPYIVGSSETYESICNGSVIFSYVIPDFLHLAAYFYAVLVFRTSDDDQLNSLMERVFLYSSNLRDGFASQRKLVKTLWIFVISSLIWMTLSFVSVNVMMAESSIDFKWIDDSQENVIKAMKVLLVISTLCHDMIQATVISNYCLQAQLLTSYLHFLRGKLIQNPIQPSEWMRDISEFKKLLLYFNEELAPSVAVFTVINLGWVISGTFWMFNYDHVDRDNIRFLGLSALNVLLWALIAIAPFIQAARLTNACELMQSIGHEIRIRPFVYQDTPGYKLDTLLLYTSSLKMDARLFKVPITGKYICTFSAIAAIAMLVLGQLHYIR